MDDEQKIQNLYEAAKEGLYPEHDVREGLIKVADFMIAITDHVYKKKAELEHLLKEIRREKTDP